MGDHQRHLVRVQLKHVDMLNCLIADLEAEIDERMRPFHAKLEQIDCIPGFGKIGAQGGSCRNWHRHEPVPSAAHLASWAKVCPSLNESAGKRGPTPTGKGDPYLRRTLVEAAWAATRCKKSNYFKSQFYHLKPRLGSNKAILAVAHSMLVTIYWMLSTGKPYEDLGGAYFDERNKEAAIRQAVRRLEHLGQRVILVPAA